MSNALVEVNGITIAADIVKIKNGKAVTTSLDVAAIFGKEHYNVLRDIEAMPCSEDFRKFNFEFSSYRPHGAKRPYPMYELTRDGFAVLVMGFNGADAFRFKEAYIAAFNRMEAELSKPKALSLPDFTNPAIAARAWAEEYEAKTKAQEQLALAAPKAALVDEHGAGGLTSITAFVRTLNGVNSTKSKEDLKWLGYLYKTPGRGNYRVRSQYRDVLFVEKRNIYSDGKMDIFITDKGKERVVKHYQRGDLTMKAGYVA